MDIVSNWRSQIWGSWDNQHLDLIQNQIITSVDTAQHQVYDQSRASEQEIVRAFFVAYENHPGCLSISFINIQTL